MTSEWLLIALPVVFLLGWAAARLDIRHIHKSAGELPRIYLRGLTHLLNRDDDKALDAFLEISSHDSTQLQFAIGALCRRKGEHERALQIHRKLYNREDLPVGERHRALWALCQDFANLGMIDYSEKYARLLLNEKDYQERAFNQLLTTYQLRRDYHAALKLLDEFGDDAALLRRATVAQFYCEMADAADDAEQQRRYYDKALEINPDCARAQVALAMLEPNSATARRRQIEQRAPQYLWLLLSTIDSADHTTALRWLRTYPSPILFEAVYKRMSNPTQRRQLCEEMLSRHQYRQAARYWLGDGAPLRERAARAGASRAAGGNASAGNNGNAPQQNFDARDNGGAGGGGGVSVGVSADGVGDGGASVGDGGGFSGGDVDAWLAIKELFNHQNDRKFICRSCEYQVKHFSWQCPGCLQWESFDPIH